MLHAYTVYIAEDSLVSLKLYHEVQELSDDLTTKIHRLIIHLVSNDLSFDLLYIFSHHRQQNHITELCYVNAIFDASARLNPCFGLLYILLIIINVFCHSVNPHLHHAVNLLHHDIKSTMSSRRKIV